MGRIDRWSLQQLQSATGFLAPLQYILFAARGNLKDP